MSKIENARKIYLSVNKHASVKQYPKKNFLYKKKTNF